MAVGDVYDSTKTDCVSTELPIRADPSIVINRESITTKLSGLF